MAEISAAKQEKSGWRSSLGRWLGLLGVFLLKFKWLLFMGLKFLGPGLSMLLMLVVYAQVFGWGFAAGFMGLIFLHELGHLAVLRFYGLKASLPVFIPFVGAMIAMKEMPRDAQMEALVGYGGPFAGGLASTACLVGYGMTKNPLWLVWASTGFFLNLFNLLPVAPLDGGRIVTAISRWIWVPGLILLGWLAWVTHHPLLILIWFLGAYQAYKRFFGVAHPESESYYHVKPWIRWSIGFAYVGLVLYLGVMEVLTQAWFSAVRGA